MATNSIHSNTWPELLSWILLTMHNEMFPHNSCALPWLLHNNNVPLQSRCRIQSHAIIITKLNNYNQHMQNTIAKCLVFIMSIPSSLPSLDRSERSSAVMSLSSLCLIIGKPPKLQIMAWSTSKGAPHAQDDGKLLSCQPYRRATASLKAPLWSAKPWLDIGSTFSHIEAPFSLEHSTSLCFFCDSWLKLRSASFSCLVFLVLTISCCASLILALLIFSFCCLGVYQRSQDAAKSSDPPFVELAMFIPPSRVGRAMMFC